MLKRNLMSIPSLDLYKYMINPYLPLNNQDIDDIELDEEYSGCCGAELIDGTYCSECGKEY